MAIGEFSVQASPYTGWTIRPARRQQRPPAAATLASGLPVPSQSLRTCSGRSPMPGAGRNCRSLVGAQRHALARHRTLAHSGLGETWACPVPGRGRLARVCPPCSPSRREGESVGLCSRLQQSQRAGRGSDVWHQHRAACSARHRCENAHRPAVRCAHSSRISV